MRYDTGFLMECLLLRIRSKEAYLKILERKLLPLPHPSTIRRLLSCMPCSFGQNQFALTSIQRNLEGKSTSMRYGSLVWDEMAIKEDITFNSQKLQFDGHVDYGEEIVISKHCGQLADHALLFVFRPYLASWIQPFAVYATKGAAPGESLHELLCKAIVALRSHGAIVKSVVCDGSQSNKRVMALFGVIGTQANPEFSFSLPQGEIAEKPTVIRTTNLSSDREFEYTEEVEGIDQTGLDDWQESDLQENESYANVTSRENLTISETSSFQHLLEENEKIYFFVDVPHLFKCVRNYIFNKKYLQVGMYRRSSLFYLIFKLTFNFS